VPRHVARLIAQLVVDYFAARHAARHRILHPRRASGASAVTRLIVDYFAYATRSGASARHAAPHRLLRLRRASGFLDTSRGSSTTASPHAGSSSTTSPTPRVRVPRHVAPLVVDYFPSRRLVVDYFAYAVRPGASARRAARRRLLRLA
jgi:hypothetical protein